uniref:Uncharacterized protein n=1 Tax=Anguilla anguilla TaxID=7936 RepID=A0A0E9XVA5_ANGAN
MYCVKVHLRLNIVCTSIKCDDEHFSQCKLF